MRSFAPQTLSLALVFSAVACAPEELAERKDNVVYGTDDRTDVYAHSSAVLRARASQSTVALMHTSGYNASDPDNVRFTGRRLSAARNLCTDQRFRDDPVSAWCSGTLIDDDLVLTAGHCLRNAADCSNVRFVFKYYRDAAGSMARVSTADIFRCQEVVARREANGLDYAVVRLDRAAAPRFTPAPVRAGDAAMEVGAQVAVIGSGSGIPFKIDDGGRVRSPRASRRDFFVANTDTFGGNSGSGVYDASGAVAGILVRGDTDYVYRDRCQVVNTCSTTGCRGEDITYVAQAVRAYCAVASSARLCGNPNPNPNPDPNPGPVDASGGFDFSASNTNSARQNTVDGVLSLQAGDVARIGSCGLPGAQISGDGYLRAYVGAAQVAYNDDACGGRGSQLQYTASGAEQLQIRAGCYAAGACSGRIAVQVTRASAPDPDPNPNPNPTPNPAANTLSFDQRDTNSGLRNTANRDIQLNAGDVLRIGTCGVGSANYSGDTVLRLFSGSTEVVNNDDACGGRGSQLSYTASSAGSVQIRVGCYAGSACSGTLAWEITAGGGVSPSQGTFPFNLRNTNTARQNTADRQVTVAEGQVIQLGTCSLAGARTTMGDTYIRLLGPGGALVATNDDACNYASYLRFTATQAGTYTLRVGCYGAGVCAGTAAYRVD